MNQYLRKVVFAMLKTEAGIREAKARFSSLIKEVKEGKEITITERGIPVAKLMPLTNEEISLEQKIAGLEQSGLIGKKPAFAGKLPQPLPLKDNKAQQFLGEDRNR